MAKYILSAFADEVTSNFAQQLKYLNKQSIDFIELRSLDDVNVSSLTIEKAKEYKQMMEKHNIRASAIGSPIGKIDITKDQTEHFELFTHALDLAELFETDKVRMFSYFYPKGTDVHDFREQILENLGKMLDEAEKRGIKLCHENEARIYGEAPVDCEDILKYFGGRMKAVFDMGNFRLGGYDPLEGYDRLHTYVEYIHIKDGFSNGVIVPAGEGEGKIKEILAMYNDYTDREVFLTLEPHLITFSGLNKLSNMDDIKVQNAFETPELAFDKATENLRNIIASIN